MKARSSAKEKLAAHRRRKSAAASSQSTKSSTKSSSRSKRPQSMSETKTPKGRAPDEFFESTRMSRSAVASDVASSASASTKEYGLSKSQTTVPSSSRHPVQNTWWVGQQKETILYVGAASGVILVISVVVLLVMWLQSGPTVRICNSEYCTTHATMLRAAMNSSVDPCGNFYRFTCGSWKPRGAETSMIGYIFAKTAQIAIQEMNETAGSLIPAAPMYYRSCLVKASPRDELDMFKRFKQGLGLMWPEAPQGNQTHPLVALLNMTINWNYHMLFHLRAMPEYRSRPPTLYIRRGRLGPNWQNMALEEFTDVVKKHLTALGVDTNGTTHQDLYGVVRRIMNAAISIPPDATRDKEFPLDVIFAYMKVNADLFRYSLSDMLTPQFTWHGNSPVFLEDESILEKLDDLLRTYQSNVPLLMQGLSWVFIRDNLWVVVGKPDLRYSGDRDALQNLLKRACLSYVESSFGLVVLAKHIHARYDEAMRKKLDAIFNGVKEEVIREVNNTPWIQQVIKRTVENKVRNVGFNAMPGEDYFSADSLVELYNSFSSAISASFMENYINLAKAYRRILGTENFISIYSKRPGGGAPSRYNYYYNIAFLSLGALQPPILYSGGTLAMTYGSVGTLLAECMVRSFDRHGVAVDEKGEAREWWGPDWPGGYREKIECDLIGDSDVVVGSIEQRERLFAALFPLAPALTASYGAFRSAVLAQAVGGYVEDIRLEGLEDYTGEQVFFMTYCLMKCQRGGDGRECNLPLRHTPDFARAFYCRESSPMNPDVKCLFLA